MTDLDKIATAVALLSQVVDILGAPDSKGKIEYIETGFTEVDAAIVEARNSVVAMDVELRELYTALLKRTN